VQELRLQVASIPNPWRSDKNETLHEMLGRQAFFLMTSYLQQGGLLLYLLTVPVLSHLKSSYMNSMLHLMIMDYVYCLG
jgi:hypothetical protein